MNMRFQRNPSKWHVVGHAGSFTAIKTNPGAPFWGEKIVAGPFAKKSEAEAQAKAMRAAQYLANNPAS
jgi:hypothetical protein